MDSKITLYCLPFAGGNSYSYRAFQEHTALNQLFSLVPIELPGRGRRIREPLLDDIELLADDALQQLLKLDLTQPYAIYGHSMGALLGYLITKRLIQQQLPQPTHLFFTGCAAPAFVTRISAKSDLPLPEFAQMLRELGGCPPEILNDPQLLEFFAPMLRADFKAVEVYNYQVDTPFDIGMTVLMGDQDSETPTIYTTAWQQETTQPIFTQTFQGDHFFIFNYLDEIAAIFAQQLSNCYISANNS